MSSAQDIRSAFDAAGTDKGAYHEYEHVYARVGDPTSILELGIDEGRSLAAWRMLWPRAEIWGVDVDVSHLVITLDDHMHVLRGDGFCASSPVDHRLKFDLVVDDASHRSTAQLMGIDLYWPQVALQGWYVIEDIFNVQDLTIPYFDRYDKIMPGEFIPDGKGYHVWIMQKTEDRAFRFL